MIQCKPTWIDSLDSDEMHQQSIKSILLLKLEFKKKLIEKTKDMPIEYQKAVDDNFWDLL